MPDTDLIFNINEQNIIFELENNYKIDFNKKIILIALKPSNLEEFIQLNNKLIQMVMDEFGNKDKYEIICPN